MYLLGVGNTGLKHFGERSTEMFELPQVVLLAKNACLVDFGEADLSHQELPAFLPRIVFYTGVGMQRQTIRLLHLVAHDVHLVDASFQQGHLLSLVAVPLLCIEAPHATQSVLGNLAVYCLLPLHPSASFPLSRRADGHLGADFQKSRWVSILVKGGFGSCSGGRRLSVHAQVLPVLGRSVEEVVVEAGLGRMLPEFLHLSYSKDYLFPSHFHSGYICHSYAPLRPSLLFLIGSFRLSALLRIKDLIRFSKRLYDFSYSPPSTVLVG